MIRISWLATATNELMWPRRSASSVAERVEVGVGQRAERHGQDVELARLDERQQQPERAVELGDLDQGRRLRAAALPEADGGSPGRCSSVGLVGEPQQLAELGVDAGLLVADQLDRPRRTAGQRGQLGRALGMGPQPLEGGPNPGSTAATRQIQCP